MKSIEKGIFGDSGANENNSLEDKSEVIFDIKRHGNKGPDGNLSEEGKEKIKEQTAEIIKEIELSPEGTIIGFVPSNIGRTQETRDKFEEEITKNFENKDEYEILDINQADEIKAAIEKKKKVLIKGFAYSSLLGFKPGKGIGKEWQRLIKTYKIDENLVGRIWAANPEELKKIQEENPEINSQDIKPSNFTQTPEELTANQLKWMKRVLDISREFTNSPVKLYGISHNFSTDFAALKLLGKQLDAKTIEESGGGRNFLESHQVRIEGGKIYVSYRGMEREFDESELEDIIKNLKEESKQRKEMWKKEDL